MSDFAKDTNVPINDCINRQAAIELVDWYQHEFNECDYAFGELANELSKLPSAQQWIPVTERLPEENETVLVTDHGSWVDLVFYDGLRWWYRDGSEETDGVTAWMPLPKPWEGEKDETD